jgi:hypothetical protein
MKGVGRVTSEYGNHMIGEVSEEIDIIPVFEILCRFKTRSLITQGDSVVYIRVKKLFFYCYSSANILPYREVPKRYQCGIIIVP